MNPGLFVLSRDATFVEQVRSRFSPRFDVLSADSPKLAEARLRASPVRAVIAHLSKGTLNGHSPQRFLAELRQVVTSAPIYGLVDPDCPVEFRDLADKLICESLPLPVDFPRLERLLEDNLGLVTEMLGNFAGLPHRVLHGQTRSLITFAPSMFDMFDELKVAAAHDVTVLLIGETGCGKTFLARLIHELSSRGSERCLTVACGALPPDLIESELFGYVKGAFTGADNDKQGKFAAADRGTLLLDEIDVLAPKQQAKLLRVIETGEYEPVGSNDTQTSNARLIVASNIDLEQLVKADKFRIDLFYRLNTLSFHLPPLRERPWDIEYLARRFAVEHSRAHQIQLKYIEPEFLAALRHYQWPGNIRELENVIRRAVLYCREGVLTPLDLPSALRPAAINGIRGSVVSPQRPLTLEERVGQIERRIIEESLQRNNFHRTVTARELGISRVTLYNKMKKFGILN
jgi:DNA-binding NtrC family response regulator